MYVYYIYNVSKLYHIYHHTCIFIILTYYSSDNNVECVYLTLYFVLLRNYVR